MATNGGLKLVRNNSVQTVAPIGTGLRTPAAVPALRRPLGQILVDMGALESGNLLKAAALRAREDVRLGDILLTNGWVSEADLFRGLALQWKASSVDLATDLPDPRLIDQVGPELCLKEAMVPWRRIGGETIIATARPEDFAALRDRLPEWLAPFRMVIASERAIHDALLAQRQTTLIRRAEARVADEDSCRNNNPQTASTLALALILAVAIAFTVAPLLAFSIFFGWAMLTLYALSVLKLMAWIVQMNALRRKARTPPALPGAIATMPGRLPVISIMVPLFKERDIAARLVKRLGKLNYPRELLDILLVVEQDDDTTHEALRGTDLPRWMRVVEVPTGPIKTKPRAMNYALSFCRGSIIGVYDAEDQPDPEQLHTVARHFASAPPEVVCLQGILDYYNPRTNWLARCFTIEYAAWFRAMLPGLARMGFVIPLGGTTLFFRRDKLEELGGWDAHNVTEDADLGVRLVRRGYRTELIDTVTHEEANCRTLPWVKQRSRWLKGYAITWCVHMRDPVQLWQDLGPKQFIGFQIQFLGSLSQYLLSPLMWTSWLMAFGVPHPISAILPPSLVYVLLASFFFTEIANFIVCAWACRGEEHRHLLLWVPALHFYFPLGCLAGWRAITEVVSKPFHWEKTAHGIFDHAPAEQGEPGMVVLRAPPA